MHLTLAEAVGQALVTEDHLMKTLKAKKLKGVEVPGVGWLVDASDLFAKFQASPAEQTAPVLRVEVERGEPSTHLRRLEELLDLERQRSAELRAERDRWASIVERMMMPPVPRHVPALACQEPA